MNDLFDAPVRYLITSGSLTPYSFHLEKETVLETVHLATLAGIEMIQLREKALTASQLLELAVNAVEVVRGSGTRLLINERFDVALGAGVDGVHLTSRSIPVERLREHVPEGFLIGVSTHSATEVEAAHSEGADFAILGPVFSTPDKGKPIGLEQFGSVCRAVSPFPVIAVGGIDSSNLDEVIQTGAAGFAAIRYLNDFVRMAR